MHKGTIVEKFIIQLYCPIIQHYVTLYMTYNLNVFNNLPLPYPHLLSRDSRNTYVTMMTVPENLPKVGDLLLLPGEIKVEVTELLDCHPGKGDHKVQNPTWVKVKYK